MSMRNLLYATMLASFAAGVFGKEQHYLSDNYLTESDIDQLREKRKQRIIELRRRGMTEFEIDGYTVYALNRKNAKRKIKNFKSKEPKQ